MKTNIRRQAGFTLIELIMVIVILGILAATALPKFVNLKSDAVISSANGLRGSLSSAAAIAHAKYIITPGTTTIEGVTVTYVNGYPDSVTIGPLAGVSSADYTTIPAGTAATANSPVTSATQAAFIPASVAGTVSGLSCYVMYTEAPANGAPTIAAVTTSC